MKIPSKDLDSFAADLVGKCLGTRKDRIAAYSGLKHYYLFGSQEGDQSPYNKMGPHTDMLAAFLYSQATVQFNLSADNQPDTVMEQAELIGNRLNTYFHDHGVADLFYEALRWSLVFDSTFMKINWSRGRLVPYFIEPHNFGVLREDVPDLDRQEAFTHAYTISMSELKRRVEVLPNRDDIMRRVAAAPVQQEDAFPEPINRMIIAGTVNFTNSTTRGLVNVPDLIGQIQYKPRTGEDVVEMYELWVWDDEKDDWRTITVAAPGVVIYGRETIGNVTGIQGLHPFIHVCPNSLYDYFFGWSEIVGLIRLQDWMTERLREIRKILAMQASPPKALSGWGGLTDEKIAAMDNPGAWISDPTPNAKVETLAPDMPNDLWQELIMIQEMFNDVSGLSDVLQGKGESGVRAKSHADTLARLGSARIKQRAQTLERTLNKTGRLITTLMKHKDPHQYTMKGGTKFIAKQFTNDYEVHVDAHSASPVFVDDQKQLAFMLAKAGAVTPEGLLMVTKPPKEEILKRQLQAFQAAQAAAAQQQQALAAITGGKKAA